MALSGSQGKFAQGAWAFESTPGVMGSTWNFFRVKSIEALPEIPLVQTENMNPRGQRLQPFNLEKTLPFKFSLQPTVNEIMRLRLHHRGYGALTSLVTAPTAATAALAGLGAGLLDTGVAYTYKVTFVTAAGETEAGTASNSVSPTAGDGQVALSAIPVGPQGVTARKIYRTEGGGATYSLLATITDNTTTTYGDNLADGSLTTAAPTTNTAGAYSSAIREEETGDTPVTGIDTLSFEFDRDDGVALLLLGCVITEMAWKVEHGKFVELTVTGMASHYTYINDPVETSVNAAFSTSRLLFRGRAAADFTMKCTTGGALDGSAEVKFSESAAYTGTAIPVTADTWIDAVGDDDDPSTLSDDLYDPLQFMVTTGGVLTTDDLFTVDSDRTKMSASYVDQNPLTGVGATLSVAGTAYSVMNFDIKFVRPYDENRACGSKYTDGFVEGERVAWDVQLVKKYTSRALLALLEAGTAAILDVEMYGDKLGATNYRERHRFYWAASKFDKAGVNVTTAGALEETAVLVPYDNESASTCVETIQHSLSSLTGV